MKKNKTFKIILFMIVSIALPIYSTVASEQSVIIGIPLPLSGNLQEFGTMMKNSFEMAKTSINEAGGINGSSIEIVFADDRGKVASVKPAFNQLIAAEPVMLVGGYASSPTYQMAKLAENSLYYNTAAQITSKKLRGILTAISEVR